MTAATSASTTSRSTRLARWRESATSSNLRQRSEISLSLASVLVISVKVRRFAPSVAARASAASWRFVSSGSCSLPSSGSSDRLLALDLEAQRRHGLVEQPVPGGCAGHRLLVEQLLDLVVELVRLLLADILEPRPVVRRARVRGIAVFERRVVEPVEFELEEQKIGRERR